ncbi:response regulator [Chloroflexota bacterium]
MAKKKGTILVADDELNIRLLVGNLLGGDYDVLKASNGAEALDLARRQKPGLILMDIMMPNMDGYSACHAIKNDEATVKIPVVMVTAVGQDLIRMFAKQMGADGYITKPFQLQDLLDTIGRFL